YRGAARRRVDVLHLEAVARIPFAVLLEPLERLACPRIRIAEDRRRFAARAIPLGQQVGAVAMEAILRRRALGNLRLAVALTEVSTQESDQRHVEHVEPDHGLAAFVAMVMPGP